MLKRTEHFLETLMKPAVRERKKHALIKISRILAGLTDTGAFFFFQDHFTVVKLLYKTTDDISNKLLCKSRILSAPRRKKIQSLGLVRTAVKMSSLLIIQILNHSAPYRPKGCTVHTSHGVKCLSFQSFRLKQQAWERLEHLCVLLMNM